MATAASTSAPSSTAPPISTTVTREDWRAGLAAISREPGNVPIVERFVRFAVALATVPGFVYLVVYLGLNTLRSTDTYTYPRGITPPIIAGIAAVFSINIITGVFAYLAVQEHTITSTVTPNEEATEDVEESTRSKDD